MKILIVGGGIGGLSLAAFLSRSESDIEYDIVEKAPDWNHQGYALSIWNNGRHILNKLGLADEFDVQGKPAQNYYIYNGKGKLLRKYSLNHFYSSYGMALTLITRAQLHDWLLSKVDASKIVMNTSIEKIEEKVSGENGAFDEKTSAATNKNTKKLSVTFTNGTSGKYDLVIGADGIHSKVRNLIFQKDTVKIRPWRVWYAWVDNTFKTEAAVAEYIEPSEFIALFDTGDRTMAIIAASSNHSLWDDVKGRIEKLKSSLRHTTSLVPAIFDKLKDEEINPADLIHVHLKTLRKGNVVLLGDAAHGFEPHAGIGASMALEDGYVLAGELIQVSEKYSLDEALKNYEIRRKKRVREAERLTHKMKSWLLIRFTFLRKLVDFFIPFVPDRYFVKDYDRLMKEEI